MIQIEIYIRFNLSQYEWIDPEAVIFYYTPIEYQSFYAKVCSDSS